VTLHRATVVRVSSTVTNLNPIKCRPMKCRPTMLSVQRHVELGNLRVVLDLEHVVHAFPKDGSAMETMTAAITATRTLNSAVS